MSASRCDALEGSLADACWCASLIQEGAEPLGAAEIAAHCANVDSPWYQNMCHIQGAWALGRAGGSGGVSLAWAMREGKATCEVVSSSMWREECHFQMIDQLGPQLPPPVWVRACTAELEAFRTPCIDHGASRWLMGALGQGTAWFDADALEPQFDAITAAGAGNQRINALHRELLRISAGDDWLARCARRYSEPFCRGDTELDELLLEPELLGPAPSDGPPAGGPGLRLREHLQSAEIHWRPEEVPPWW